MYSYKGNLENKFEQNFLWTLLKFLKCTNHPDMFLIWVQINEINLIQMLTYTFTAQFFSLLLQKKKLDWPNESSVVGDLFQECAKNISEQMKKMCIFGNCSLYIDGY